MFIRRTLVLSFFISVLTSGLGQICLAVDTSKPAARITNSVNESDLIRLVGHTHPLASAKYDQGAVRDTLRMDHMFVVLRRGAEQEQALEQLIGQLHDPHSVN